MVVNLKTEGARSCHTLIDTAARRSAKTRRVEPREPLRLPSCCRTSPQSNRVYLLLRVGPRITCQEEVLMKRLSAALLGVVILATALSWAATPASALGGCGPNRHRGPWGGCRWGGQNQAW